MYTLFNLSKGSLAKSFSNAIHPDLKTFLLYLLLLLLILLLILHFSLTGCQILLLINIHLKIQI